MISPIKKDSAYWGRLAREAIEDEAAFSELYDHFFPRVYQHLMGKTKNEALADELVSETFIRMFQHLKVYDPAKGAFSTWLFRIAQNAMNKYYGSKAYTAHAPWAEDFDPADPGQLPPEKQYLDKERSRELKEAMMKLSDRERQILEMTYWLEMKSNEVGEALGMAPSSVRVGLKQAREKLRKLLEEGE